MADAPLRSNSDDARCQSSQANSARSNRHGDRAYEAIHNGFHLPRISEVPDPAQDQLHFADMQQLTRTSESPTAAPRGPYISGSESPDGYISVQDPMETPIHSFYTSRSTDAWWMKRRDGFYFQPEISSIHDLPYGQYAQYPLGTDPYPEIAICPSSSDSPAADPPALSSAATADAASLPTHELRDSHLDLIASLPTFRTRSSSPESGRPRSNAFSTPSTTLVPGRAHSTAPSTRNVSLVSANRLETVASSATVPNPAQIQRLPVTVVNGQRSSLTLISERDQQTLLPERQSYVSTVQAESKVDLVSEQYGLPKSDDVLGSSIKRAEANPKSTVDRRWFLFPRHKFRPLESNDDEGGKKRRRKMAGLVDDTSLVPLARFTNSKIRALKSSNDYWTWIQGGKELAQIRGFGGLAPNKSRPSASEPQLAETWERRPSGFREKRAEFCPGYRWSIHGVLNPRYGEPVSKTNLDASQRPEEPQPDPGNQSTPAPVPQALQWPGSSDDSSEDSMLSKNLVPLMGGKPRSNPSPSSSGPSMKVARRAYGGSCQKARVSVLNKSDNLYNGSSRAGISMRPKEASASVAISNRRGYGAYHAVDQAETQILRPLQYKATSSRRTATLTEPQESKGPTSTESLENDDIIASLKKSINRTLEEIRRRTLQRVQDGALDDALHNGPMREAALEVFESVSQSSIPAKLQQSALARSHSKVPPNRNTDDLHNQPSPVTAPLTTVEPGLRPTFKVAEHNVSSGGSNLGCQEQAMRGIGR